MLHRYCNYLSVLCSHWAHQFPISFGSTLLLGSLILHRSPVSPDTRLTSFTRVVSTIVHNGVFTFKSLNFVHLLQLGCVLCHSFWRPCLNVINDLFLYPDATINRSIQRYSEVEFLQISDQPPRWHCSGIRIVCWKCKLIFHKVWGPQTSVEDIFDTVEAAIHDAELVPQVKYKLNLTWQEFYYTWYFLQVESPLAHTELWLWEHLGDLNTIVVLCLW